MGPKGYILRQELVYLLRTHRINLLMLCEYYNVTKYKISNATYYKIEHIDAMLTRMSHGYTSPPTVAALRLGTIKIINLSEAGRIIGCGSNLVERLCEAGRLPYIHISTSSQRKVVDVNSVNQFLNSKLPQKALYKRMLHKFSHSQLLKILCTTEAGIRSYVHQGLLHPKKDEAQGSVYYSQEEVLQLLRQLLPNDTNLAVWIHRCLSEESIFYTLKETAAILGQSRDSVEKMLQVGRLPHIRKNNLTQIIIIPYWGLLHAVTIQGPVTLTKLERVFATKTVTIQKWVERGLFDCPYHLHKDIRVGRYGKACLVAIFGRYNPEIALETIGDWLLGNKIYLAAQEAAKQLGVGVQTVENLTASGALFGLRRPDGILVFTRKAVLDYKRQQNS